MNNIYAAIAVDFSQPGTPNQTLNPNRCNKTIDASFKP